MPSLAALHVYKKVTNPQDTNQTSHMDKKYKQSARNHMHALARIDMQTPFCSALGWREFLSVHIFPRTIYDQN
jgi:hypothetical protein